LAEAILNKIGGEKFHVYSAGSQPKGQINPNAIKLLQGLGYDTTNYYSKSWDEFTKPGAPKFDFIFTVCDDAAGETCPVWPGKPATAHWGIADPAAVTGNEVEIARAFQDAYRYMHNRISLFTALPFGSLDRMALASAPLNQASALRAFGGSRPARMLPAKGSRIVPISNASAILRHNSIL
jgi:arsenate reductase